MNFLTAGNRFILVIMKCHDKEVYTHAYVDSVFGLSGWLCSRLQNTSDGCMNFIANGYGEHLITIFDYTLDFQNVCVTNGYIGDTVTDGSVLVDAQFNFNP